MRYSGALALALFLGVATIVVSGQNFNFPPDPPPAPLPPSPPRLPSPNVGPINNLDDVCKVCTKQAYNTSCYSNAGASCLRAMYIYRINVLKIRDPICACYGAIAGQLLQFCPKLSSAVSYLGNCDFGCFYGTPCPFTPTLYSLLKSTNVVAPPASPPPPKESSPPPPKKSSPPPPKNGLPVSIKSPPPPKKSPPPPKKKSPPPPKKKSPPPPKKKSPPPPKKKSPPPPKRKSPPPPKKASPPPPKKGSSSVNSYSGPPSPATLDEAEGEEEEEVTEEEPAPSRHIAGVSHGRKLLQTAPAQGVSAVAVINLIGGVGATSKICYQIMAGTGGLAHVVRATINQNILGSNGPVVVELFNAKNAPKGLSGCVVTPLPLMRLITADAIQYYVQVYTTAGDARGQLLYTPRLFSLLKSTNVVPPAPCGGTCNGFMELQLSTFSATYRIATSRAAGTLQSAFIQQGEAGRNGPRLFPLFGPFIAVPSRYNTVTAPLGSILQVMADPAGTYALIGSAASPSGQLRGQFTDVLKTRAALTGKYAIPPTKVTGTASFSATMGGGGVCFSLKVDKSVGTVVEAHIHAGNSTSKGPIVVPLYDGVELVSFQTCLAVITDVTAPILDAPNQFYVHIYTEQYPQGAVRGQLSYA